MSALPQHACKRGHGSSADAYQMVMHVRFDYKTKETISQLTLDICHLTMVQERNRAQSKEVRAKLYSANSQGQMSNGKCEMTNVQCQMAKWILFALPAC